MLSEKQEQLQNSIRGVIPSFEKKTILSKTPIWVCRFQGRDRLPEVCRICVEQLERSAPSNAEVFFLTEENYSEYIDFPDYINERFRRGVISRPIFSDILRYGLLSTYGGIWVDAAILLSGNVLETALSSEVFSVRFYEGNEPLRDASRGKWIGGFWARKDDIVTFKYCYESLLHLWKQHDLAIEYLACDYIIWTTYTQIDAIKKEIDSIPVNNKQIRLLNDHINERYSTELLENILRSNDVHLINRHLDYNQYTDDGELTVFGYLVKNGSLM